MTFVNRFVRGTALGAVAMGLTLGVANAQNGSNYHVLTNNAEAAFAGIGAGGAQTPNDGIGTWVSGEDMRGSVKVDFGSPLGVQFSYRNVKFREGVCMFNPGVITGAIHYQFSGLLFVEFNGLNANFPPIFTNPICATGLPTGAAAYGLGPTSTVSFLLFGLPSGIGVTGVNPSAIMLGPDNGVLGTAGGTATIVAAAGGVVSNPLAQSGCYVVQFTWNPSAVTYLDDIDGMWHYALNSPDENMYWLMSTDEMALWQSETLFTDADVTVVNGFPAYVDYALLMATTEAETSTVLAPNGYAQNGSYYAQTENMAGGGGPNFGFDAGRGSNGISFNGLGGVKTGVAAGGFGNGNQDPAYGGKTPSLGFVTWNNKPSGAVAGFGGGRITWLGIDMAQIFGLSPELDPNITKKAGKVRLPVIGTQFIRPETQLGLGIFTHTTGLAASGWPDPDGITSGAFGVTPSAGGSINFTTGAFSGSIACNIGIPINLTYGTTGTNPSPPPSLTYDPAVSDVSGSKQCFLFP